MYLRPYMLFSTQTPKASQTFLSSSAPSGKPSLCLALNLSWLAALSGETPTTATPSLRNSGSLSVKAIASFVQPDVSSFG
jgi:hypothetical protein